MTLIIGIKCEDGIVLGSDGVATFGAMGQRTIRQSLTKLNILEDCIAVGVSGPVGLGQSISGEIQNLWEEKKFSGKNSL
jgi:20S proteasome alpha/beta subunit